MNDAAADRDGKKEDAEECKRIIYTYPLIRQSDMNEEMKAEIVELCVTACEKFNNNNENAARLVKESLDKKYGLSWHVVVGESYGLEVTHEVQSLLYMYFAGNLAICVWKCI